MIPAERKVELRREGVLWSVYVDEDFRWGAMECAVLTRADITASLVAIMADVAAQWVADLEAT